MRITIVTPGLAGGGAERSMSVLANAWVSSGKRIHVLVHSFDEPLASSSHLDPAITTSYVIGSRIAGKWPPRFKTFGILHALRRAVQKTRPDVVVAFLASAAVDTLLATFGTGTPVIVSEHSDPHVCSMGFSGVPCKHYVPGLRLRVLEALRRGLYPLAASVVCLTETAMSYFPESVRRKGRVIPNSVLSPMPASGRHNDVRNPRIVYLGRLVSVKGLDRLLRAFSYVAGTHPQWKLEIWGMGEEEFPLRQIAAHLGIANRVQFAGWTDNSHDALLGAELFVMTSHTEGFPNALCEAMACGVTPICFDCPSGPRHIIRNGIDGVLIPNGDVAGLAAMMGYLMDNEPERRRLSARAPEVLGRFGTGKVLGMWEDLLNAVCKVGPVLKG